MNLSKSAVDTIENALKHYLKYRVEFGRTTTEQLDMDDRHRLEIYKALEELAAVRSKLGYGDLFGLLNLTPMLAPDPRDYKSEAAYLEAVDKFNDVEETRYRELTGHPYDDEPWDDNLIAHLSAHAPDPEPLPPDAPDHGDEEGDDWGYDTPGGF